MPEEQSGTVPTAEINQYIAELDKKYCAGNATEHSYRPALQSLFERITSGLSVTNEPKRVACGAPDYIVTRNGIPAGYIEAKDIPVGIHSAENEAQFERYKSSLGNLIITDYISFELFIDGSLTLSATIAQADGENIKADKAQYGAFSELVQMFADYKGKTIADSGALAQIMAAKARLLAAVIVQALPTGEVELLAARGDALADQLNSFRDFLIHSLSQKEFADIFAQTIAYDMFAARLNDASNAEFTRMQAALNIPQSNPFLQKFFQHIAGYDLDDRIRWIVDALADLFNCVAVEDLLKEFGRARQYPYIHFYETFLAEYDPVMRKGRGVWYTPLPVVRFIVGAADDILKTEFNLPEGLADKSKVALPIPQDGGKLKDCEFHRVQILDPATGTGTFLAAVIDKVYEKFVNQQGMWAGYCAEHLIPRLNGFEILMASYAMAHFKLDMKLKETGCRNSAERLRVFLTNSLDSAPLQAAELPFAQWLATESAEARRIKRDVPIMVMLANPPYNVSTQNKNEWIDSLIDVYKTGLHEKKLNLDDDYIKFIRYGQYYIDKNKNGIEAYISNNSFVDGITHRQMRKSLLQSFDKIYILNLHGSAKKKECAPDGGKDENVFDIQQGGSINIFIKTGSKKEGDFATGYYHDLYGNRENKYSFLLENKIDSIGWKKLDFNKPYYFFYAKEFFR
ncbi:hypothetical protein [Treponema endosymbiont of Eucomonympha sp.]|uniref:hypothetical protein n=1 Tax=Treponema endosymbiont of Eucomonympha sp. TaxID=1580831 RepID=UPI000781D7DE|nr:hypothetical protein [Treponema endosymbiont of Eucomonympha sp.]